MRLRKYVDGKLAIVATVFTEIVGAVRVVQHKIKDMFDLVISLKEVVSRLVEKVGEIEKELEALKAKKGRKK